MTTMLRGVLLLIALLTVCPLGIANEGPFPFVLDTGSSDSPLASETLAELGLRPAEGSQGSTEDCSRRALPPAGGD